MKLIFITILSVLLLTGCSTEKTISNPSNQNNNLSSSPTDIPDSNLSSSSIDDTEVSYTLITQEEAKELMDNNDSVLVVDVRTKEEFDEGHIENAILLPVDEINTNAGTILTDKDQTILIYCRSGRRSKIASEALIELGYTKVYDFGGINTWPYDIVLN